MFDLGDIRPTKLAKSRAKGLDIDLLALLMRHTEGDWKHMTETEQKLNHSAIENGRSVISRYRFGTNIFLISTNQHEGYTEIKMADENE